MTKTKWKVEELYFGGPVYPAGRRWRHNKAGSYQYEVYVLGHKADDDHEWWLNLAKDLDDPRIVKDKRNVPPSECVAGWVNSTEADYFQDKKDAWK